ncbi:hypothetical protein BABINDRAFT_40826 [Babjeviella inositovora NRRL Y-12698]|uniref:Pantothenate kinase n=1 Tax=Babjeviella inositovora NRRL Y-12698 TaxID=984486 RepID=A0A1E3QJB2_9ASCO|nr:uncharacterized protein BABINDRAFT_40826 [Babjeviella inositovora NRRL Y-12698]ODQ77781.1 hypothetical protein BABINDRAFT_40826 [Babjeviella inositovora NRRL Y-12698]
MPLSRAANGSPEPGANEELISWRYANPGTLQIDCLGAFISRDPFSEESSSEEDEHISRNTSLDLLALAVKEEYEDGFTDAAKKISLPYHSSNITHISLDIGGTLTKLVYFTKNDDSPQGGKMHFKYYQTENFESEVLRFLQKKLVNKRRIKNREITHILATGGGSCKFQTLMRKTFPKVKIIAKDEMECLITGLDFFITEIPREIYTYDYNQDKIQFLDVPKITTKDDLYPYLLVNIGSGVSMIKVVGPEHDNFERIGGSSLGGGTLWGLLSLLTTAQDYNEMLDMAKRGNNENIDLLVGDIYGTNYNKIGLKSNHIASSFAKVFKKLKNLKRDPKAAPLTISEKLAQFNQEDISRSLLYSVSNNIGQIAYLQAQRYNLKRIYFGGSYILGHKQTIHTLSYAVDFWSKGVMKAYFLRHEGYLGSVGAFLNGPVST